MARPLPIWPSFLAVARGEIPRRVATAAEMRARQARTEGARDGF